MVIAEIGVVNGLYLDHVPPWRQLLFVVLIVTAYLHGRHLPERRDWLLLTIAATPGAVYIVPDFWNGVTSHHGPRALRGAAVAGRSVPAAAGRTGAGGSGTGRPA